MAISLTNPNILKFKTIGTLVPFDVCVYYTMKNSVTKAYEERTLIQTVNGEFDLLEPLVNETFIIKNIYVSNTSNTNTTGFFKIMINLTVVSQATLPANNSWQLIGGTPKEGRGIHHIDTTTINNQRFLNFWGDVAETINLGSVTITDGIDGTDGISVDHISSVDNGNNTQTVTFWGDIGETINLGSIIVPS